MKSSFQKRAIVHGLLIFLFCLLAYLNSFRNIDFMLDDWDLIVNNEKLSHSKYLLYEFFPGLNPVAGSPLDYYRPLLLTVIWISHWICGDNVWGYHLINWILFCGACLSAYIFIDRYFKNTLVALLTALLFAVHPFNSYIVNNAAAGFFGLQLILLCWSAIFFKSFSDHSEKKRYLATSAVLFILALSGHDSALTFPVFLFILSFLVMQNISPQQLLLRLSPLFGISLFFYIMKVSQSVAINNAFSNNSASLFQHTAMVAKLMAWYIQKFFTGADVIFIWATRAAKTNVAGWNIILFIAVALCLGVYFFKRIHPVLRFVAGSLLLSTFAVAMACRFEPSHGWIMEPPWLFFISISFFSALALVFSKIRDMCHKAVFSIIFAAYVGMMLLNSWALNNVWANEIKYCSYWAKQAPGFTTPLSFLASAYAREGDLAASEEVLKKALKHTEQPILLYKLGMIYYMRQQWDEAEMYFRKALVLAPHSVTLRTLLNEIEKK